MKKIIINRELRGIKLLSKIDNYKDNPEWVDYPIKNKKEWYNSHSCNIF